MLGYLQEQLYSSRKLFTRPCIDSQDCRIYVVLCLSLSVTVLYFNFTDTFQTLNLLCFYMKYIRNTLSIARKEILLSKLIVQQMRSLFTYLHILNSCISASIDHINRFFTENISVMIQFIPILS